MDSCTGSNNFCGALGGGNFQLIQLPNHITPTCEDQGGLCFDFGDGNIFVNKDPGPGSSNPPTGGGINMTYRPVPTPSKTATCYSLAGGHAPHEGFKSWLQGSVEAGLMTGPFDYGMGPSSVGFGPTSLQANEMMASPLVQQNIHDFLKSGKSWMNGWQNFGLGELATSGANPTGQFVGSYVWAASR